MSDFAPCDCPGCREARELRDLRAHVAALERVVLEARAVVGDTWTQDELDRAIDALAAEIAALDALRAAGDEAGAAASERALRGGT